MAVADVSEERLSETVRLVEGQGGSVLAARCDVTRREDIASPVGKTIEAFGRLGIAVNNAGVEQPPTPLAETDEAGWDRIVDTNLRSVFLSMKQEIAAMGEHGGSIVNIASGAAVIGIRGQAAYAAAKHGVVGLTKSAALECAADGIQINAVCPGIIETIEDGSLLRRHPRGARPRHRAGTHWPDGETGGDRFSSAVAVLRPRGFAVCHALVVDGGQTVGI